MKRRSGWFAVAVLGAAVMSGVVLERSKAQFTPPGSVPYQTGCEAVDATTVEGFVRNNGTGMVRVDGLVRFTFTVANSMSRPAVSVQGSALIPPGRTVSVARARLVWSLMPGETCQFDVTGALR
ncbi:MAG: hypothetical protein NDJ72_02440 [Elusimicrobia bacterium]|nr:hypothetical protein [Elusimicrobiota bacterium]